VKVSSEIEPKRSSNPAGYSASTLDRICSATHLDMERLRCSAARRAFFRVSSSIYSDIYGILACRPLPAYYGTGERGRAMTGEERYRRKIDHIIDYIEAHLEEKLSLDELSREAGFSPHHFHRIFSAFRVGFDDSATFARAFKKRFVLPAGTDIRQLFAGSRARRRPSASAAPSAPWASGSTAASGPTPR
jgi:AraC-like DNA-binding protein